MLKKIKDLDPYCLEAVPLLCTVMIELGKQAELYLMAHKLVESNPELAVSWYAVGSYYFLVGKYPHAKKYFDKARQIDKNFAEAWIAYGHCFSAQDESEKALAAYRSAVRLFPGCHFAHLYLGMEFQRQNHLKLALTEFEMAAELCPTDPSIYNEMGTTRYKE